MQALATVFALILIVAVSVVPWQTRQNGRGDHDVIATMIELGQSTPAVSHESSRQRTVRTVTSFPIARQNYFSLPSQYSNGVADDQRDLIMSIADSFQVPAGILYGIWTNESGRLLEGYSDHWPTAVSLLAHDSSCRRWLAEHGRDPGQCDDWYESLRRVCAQQRRDGTQVCDINTVRVSQTFDLGPMQHNAAAIVHQRSARRAGATECSMNSTGDIWCWSSHIIDINGDGVFDPQQLAEAMAATAQLLAANFTQCQQSSSSTDGCWEQAVNEYAGQSDYFSRRIRVLWSRWCAVDGYCG